MDGYEKPAHVKDKGTTECVAQEVVAAFARKIHSMTAGTTAPTAEERARRIAAAIVDRPSIRAAHRASIAAEIEEAITQERAEAERRGAERMRELAASQCLLGAAHIRALPLTETKS